MLEVTLLMFGLPTHSLDALLGAKNCLSTVVAATYLLMQGDVPRLSRVVAFSGG